MLVFDLLVANSLSVQTKVSKVVGGGSHWQNGNWALELKSYTWIDDIWSHNFHNAVKSRAFEKNVIYLQHQDHHNM